MVSQDFERQVGTGDATKAKVGFQTLLFTEPPLLFPCVRKLLSSIWLGTRSCSTLLACGSISASECVTTFPIPWSTSTIICLPKGPLNAVRWAWFFCEVTWPAPNSTRIWLAPILFKKKSWGFQKPRHKVKNRFGRERSQINHLGSLQRHIIFFMGFLETPSQKHIASKTQSFSHLKADRLPMIGFHFPYIFLMGFLETPSQISLSEPRPRDDWFSCEFIECYFLGIVSYFFMFLAYSAPALLPKEPGPRFGWRAQSCAAFWVGAGVIHPRGGFWSVQGQCYKTLISNSVWHSTLSTSTVDINICSHITHIMVLKPLELFSAI